MWANASPDANIRRIPPQSTPALALMSLLLTCFASPLAAQRVELLVREEGSSTPVGGAIARLVADTGVVFVGLTAASGRLSLVAPSPGNYRIKLDRIGFVGLLSAPFELALDQVLQSELLMPTARFELPTVEVRSRSRCEQQGPGGAEAFAVWEEIQKALTASVITEQAAAVPLRVREFQRWLRRDGTLIHEYHVLATETHGPVYASLSPERLAAEGFLLTTDRDSLVFAVPDARLLISDAFSATHCFGVQPGEAGLIGLTFEPAPGRRLPDVSGTIWVDRNSGELRHLEYEYTSLPGLLARAGLGGRVEFRRLPDGEWIVGYWHVRTPEIRVTEVRTTGNVRSEMPRHLGYVELGGRVEVQQAGGGAAPLAIVTGQLTDQTAEDAPLTGAVIQVDGYPATVQTDPQGHYLLSLPLYGPQTVTASHPKLGHFGPATLPVTLSIGDTARADFAVPPVADLAGQACGAGAARRAGVIGVLLLEDGSGGVGVEIKARWEDPARGRREARARTGKRGLYTFCDLPAETPLLLVVERRGRIILERQIELGFREFAWADLWLLSPP